MVSLWLLSTNVISRTFDPGPLECRLGWVQGSEPHKVKSPGRENKRHCVDLGGAGGSIPACEASLRKTAPSKDPRAQPGSDRQTRAGREASMKRSMEEKNRPQGGVSTRSLLRCH